MEQLRAGDHSRNEEWTITRKDGQRRLLAISTSSFEDDDGIEAVVALMHDVTERKRSESALRESQRENQLLLEAIPDMMMRVRRDGTYVGFKYPRDFQPWKHETRSQIIGSNIRNSVPPEISELALECIAAALDTSQTQHFQYTIPVGGQRRHREARVVPAAEDEVLIIIRDTTQRRQAEEQRDLAEQRLVQQQEQLAHVSRLSAVGEMVAGIAHEITQPLGAISNYASAAATTLERQAALDSEVIRWNQQIAEQASRAGQIIDRLRRFAQRGEPRREPHSLCEVIREGIALVQANARRRRANISFAAPAKPITINADRVQVQQVLVNLLNNALEAMAHQPQSRRTAEVSVDVDERGCRVAVSDDGCGLPREAQDKIFEAFYTTKPDGMGMGLAICRTIIEGHGGQLQVKANPTGGAIVYFTLPRQS